MYYKRNGWSMGSSPWVLDERASYRDFDTLQYYGGQTKQILANNDLNDFLKYRANILRSQRERNSIDDCLDIYFVGNGPFKDCCQMILKRCTKGRRFLYTYGTPSAPHKSSYQPLMWILDVWSLEANEVIL